MSEQSMGVRLAELIGRVAEESGFLRPSPEETGELRDALAGTGWHHRMCIASEASGEGIPYRDASGDSESPLPPAERAAERTLSALLAARFGDTPDEPMDVRAEARAVVNTVRADISADALMAAGDAWEGDDVVGHWLYQRAAALLGAPQNPWVPERKDVIDVSDGAGNAVVDGEATE